MPTYPINPRQAEFLTELSRAASNYRDALDSLQKGAAREIQYLDQKYVPNGISHQTLNEVVKFQAKLEMMMNTAYYILEIEDKDKFEEYVNLALTPDENGLRGNHYFRPES